MGRAEAIARRMVREGIPIVRLWEGHAAFVSLGLNQRRKPGLWLIQKVR
jgi:lipoate-protein ligase A